MSHEIIRPVGIRQTAIKSLVVVAGVWLLLTAASLTSLAYNSPEWTRVWLLVSVWIVPGLAAAEIVRIRDLWLGRTDAFFEARQAWCLVATGAVALTLNAAL